MCLDFVAASDRSHCNFVLCAVRRGKMTDGPSASALALASKIAFQPLLPGASRMAERVFRGKQASWHVEFIWKLVSVDQANLDAARGGATLADKAFLWLTKAKRGELSSCVNQHHDPRIRNLIENTGGISIFLPQYRRR